MTSKILDTIELDEKYFVTNWTNEDSEGKEICTDIEKEISDGTQLAVIMALLNDLLRLSKGKVFEINPADDEILLVEANLTELTLTILDTKNPN